MRVARVSCPHRTSEWPKRKRRLRMWEAPSARRANPGLRPVSIIAVGSPLLPAERLAQLDLRPVEDALLRLRQVLARAVAVKDQHRQR
jgi:hypothetical protein